MESRNNAHNCRLVNNRINNSDTCNCMLEDDMSNFTMNLNRQLRVFVESSDFEKDEIKKKFEQSIEECRKRMGDSLEYNPDKLVRERFVKYYFPRLSCLLDVYSKLV